MADGGSMRLSRPPASGRFLQTSLLALALLAVCCSAAAVILLRNDGLSGAVPLSDIARTGLVLTHRIPDLEVGEVRGSLVEIPNDSRRDLRYVETISTCACVAADFEPQVLASQEVGRLKITAHAPDTSGRFPQTLTVRFRDDADVETDILVYVDMHVRHWAVANPQSLDLGILVPGGARQREISISTDTPAAIACSASSDAISVTPLIGRSDSEQRFVVTATIPEGEQEGRKTALLSFAHNVRPHTTLGVPIVYHVVQPLEVVPRQIVITDAVAGRTVERRLRLSVAIPTNGQTPDLSCSLGTALSSAIYEMGDDGRTWEVSVAFTPTPDQEFWSDTIVIRLADQKAHIPFVAHVTSR